MWTATVLTLFPEMFPGPLAHSLSGKALAQKIWQLNCLNIRDYTLDRHKTVDDTPFGGGAGMVLRPDILETALRKGLELHTSPPRLLYMTPRGTPFSQDLAKELAQENEGLLILAGRYEGVDQRFLDSWPFEEVSLGDYVLSGGELPALVLLDACIRLLPGVVGKEESLTQESFELGLLEHSHYTRPQVWKDREVPEVLLSGHHERIRQWRQAQSEEETKRRRPDLWALYEENARRKS